MTTVFYSLLTSLGVLFGTVGNLAAATTVYFYGIDSPEDTNSDPVPLYVGPNGYIGTGGGVNLSIAGGFGDPFFYRSDATLIPSGRTGNVPIDFLSGAILGDDNYSYLKFGEGYFEPFESIAQFHFDEAGSVWLVAIATTNTGTTVSSLRGNSDGRRITVAEGASAIAAARVPEPSTYILCGMSFMAMAAFRTRTK